MQNKQQIKSLQVGFSIIDYVAKSSKPVKFNEIHNATKITKSNLYKYLNTLTFLKVLHRDKETGLYSGGPTLIEYGMTTINSNNIIDKVNPYLEKINIVTGATTLLTTWTTNGPIIAKMIYSRDGFNLGGQVGTHLPITTAAGKLFGTFMKGPLAEEWITEETKNLSKHEFEQLKSEFNSIRHNCISFAHEALAHSVKSVAIPIFDYNKDIVGAIVNVGFESTIPNSINCELSRQLVCFSNQVSTLFGYTYE